MMDDERVIDGGQIMNLCVPLPGLELALLPFFINRHTYKSTVVFTEEPQSKDSVPRLTVEVRIGIRR